MSTLIEYFKQVGGFEQNVEEEEEGSAREQNDSFPHSSYIHPTNENVNTNHKTILLVAFDFDADRECRRLLSSSSSSSSSSSLSSSSCLHPITITKSSSSSLSSPSFSSSSSSSSSTPYLHSTNSSYSSLPYANEEVAVAGGRPCVSQVQEKERES